MFKKTNLPDRKFLNKILDVVFSPEELASSSAKGKASHGISHKPLDEKKMDLVDCAYNELLPSNRFI